MRSSAAADLHADEASSSGEEEEAPTAAPPTEDTVFPTDVVGTEHASDVARVSMLLCSFEVSSILRDVSQITFYTTFHMIIIVSVYLTRN